MSILHAPSQPTHDLGGARFTSLATPSRGSTETAIWQVDLDPGTPPTPHSVTREEVFVVLAGVASVTIAGVLGSASTGDSIVVPADTTFELSNAGIEPLTLLCCLPIGGQARLEDGTTFTPPWAE